MRKLALLLSVAFTAVLSTSAFAERNALESLRATHNLPAKFDAEMIRKSAGDLAVESIQKSYRVGEAFTEADIVRSSGERSIQELRRRYSIGPNFTCADLRRAVGANRLAERMEYLGLATGFTERDYIMALGRDELRFMFGHMNGYDLSKGVMTNYPKDSTEYFQREAEALLQEKVKIYPGLSARFAYEQYREVAGPETSGWFRAEYDFKRDAGYEDMKRAVAAHLQKVFAAEKKLPETWTFDELAMKLGEKRLRLQREDLSLNGPISETSLSEALGARDSEYLVKGIDENNCSESAIALSRGEESGRIVRSMFDLDSGFTAAQVREAAGESAIAKVRRTFGVAGPFTSKDLEEAQVRLSAEAAAEKEKRAAELKALMEKVPGYDPIYPNGYGKY